MIRAVTVDFWETLYFHAGSADFRKQVRDRVLNEKLVALGYGKKPHVTTTYFEVVDKFVKECWRRNQCPARDIVVNHAWEHYLRELPIDVLDALLNSLYELYQTELKPNSALGAAEVVSWLASRWPLYIVSDTYTIIGDIIDGILHRDGLLDKFSGRFYSDRVGLQKPDPTTILNVAALERVFTSEILHIGDRLDKDGELAKRAGCKCIIVNLVADDEIHSHSVNSDTILAICSDLSSVRKVLETHGT